VSNLFFLPLRGRSRIYQQYGKLSAKRYGRLKGRSTVVPSVGVRGENYSDGKMIK
jgi:hypothetical protein